MKPPRPDTSDSDGNDESPGVPGFGSWRAIYLFVFVFFLFCVLLLALFSRAFA
jgi:hypothetical protein